MLREKYNSLVFHKPPVLQFQNAITASVSHLFYGMSLTWSSSFLNERGRTDSKLIFTEAEQSFIINIIIFGTATAAIVTAVIGNQIGRKTTFQLTALLTFLINLLLLYYTHVFMICFVRFLTGVLVDWMCSIAAIHIGETTSSTVRGKFLVYNSVLLTVGLFLGFTLSGYVSYPVYNLCFSGLCLVYAVCVTFLIVESPYYYMMCGDEDLTKAVLKRFKLSNNISDDFESIKLFIEMQRKEKARFYELWRVSHLRLALLLCIGHQVVNVITGIDIFTTYMMPILNEAKIDLMEPTHISMVFSACGFISVTVSSIFIDKYGRRKLLLISTCLTSLFMFIFSFYLFLVRINFNYSNEIKFVAPVSMFLYKVSMGIGLTSLSRICIGEFFPIKYGPVGCCIAKLSNSLGCFCVLEVYSILKTYLGLDGLFFGFAIALLISGCTLTWLLVETKNRTLPEVQKILRNYQIFDSKTR